MGRFTVLVVSLGVGGKVLISMMGCLLCVELWVSLQALDFQGTEIAFHVSLIQVAIAGRPEQQSSWFDNEVLPLQRVQQHMSSTCSPS